MQKLRRIFFSARFVLLLLVLMGQMLVQPQQAQAAVDCANKGISNIKGLSNTQYTQGKDTSATITLNSDMSLNAGNYKLMVYNESIFVITNQQGESGNAALATSMSFTITDAAGGGAFQVSSGGQVGGDDTKYVYLATSGGSEVCYLGSYVVVKAQPVCMEPPQLSQTRNITTNGKTEQRTCYYNNGTGCIQKGIPTNVTLGGIELGNGGYLSKQIRVNVFTNHFASNSELFTLLPVNNNATSFTHTFTTGDEYKIEFDDLSLSNKYQGQCNISLVVKDNCDTSAANTCQTTNSAPSSTGTYKRFELCNQIIDNKQKQLCSDCMNGKSSSGKPGVWTAIGCIGRDPESITQRLIQLGIGMGGGLCLLTCLAGGFILTTSEGNPKKVEEAKEMITGAIVGLLFVIFSVVILQFIGVTIFHIPGFGETPKTN